MTNNNDKIISAEELLYETHIELERQGPGSAETTLRALSFIDNPDKISKVLDIGCGTGGQTMVIAQKIGGKVIGLDLYSGFIKAFDQTAKKLKLGDRVSGVVGSMYELSFEVQEFDLIWSEGAVYEGFEKLLRHWHDFLKKDGYIAVSYASWFTDERPAEVEKFWGDAGCELLTIGQNISAMQRAGFQFVAAFPMPESCWIDNYFTPRTAAEMALVEKYPNNKELEEAIALDKYEIELYSKYKQYYGYAFYIGKKN